MKLLSNLNFFKIIRVLNLKEIFLLSLSFLISLIIIFIEMLGISVVPIAIINYLDFEQTIFDNFLFRYLKKLDFYFFLILISLLFFLKSITTYLHQIYDYIIIKKSGYLFQIKFIKKI